MPPNFSHKCEGKVLSRSVCSASGATSFEKKVETVLRSYGEASLRVNWVD
jgi:hypothetical protein